MTTYDIIYDVMLLDAELEERGMSRNFEIFDGDDGYVSFLEEKVNEYEKMCDNYYFSDENFGKFSTSDAMADFVEKNVEKWKRELRGNHLYKIKMVLEIECEDNYNIDNTIEILESRVNISMPETFDRLDYKVINTVGKEVNE